MNDIYAELGIDTHKLGCVMLNVMDPGWGTHVVSSLWYRPSEADREIVGPGDFGQETQPHVTLLYGLLENANTWREYVDEVLKAWDTPQIITVKSFGVFRPSHGLYDVVVAHVYEGGLSAAHKRLSRLPHVDTYLDYAPHMTIGYVLPGTGDYVVGDLNVRVKDKTLIPTTINYGDPE